jgi:outer membrane biosynthesis protein TonB
MGKLALIASIVLHASIIALLYVNFGGLYSTKLKDSGYVVFDYVDIGEKSKAPVLSQTDGKISKQKAQTPEQDTVVNATNQPSEGAKIPDKPDKKKEPEVAKEDKKAKDDAVPIGKKKKPEKHDKKPAKKKAKTGKSNEKAIVNLRKNKKNETKDKKAAKKSFNSLLDGAIATENNANSGVKAEEVGATLTASQVDLIRQTIRKCWHFPAGLKNAEDLVVDIQMELDQAGNVKSAKIIDSARVENDPDFRIAAENAYRAVLDPNCNPLPLPPEKYEEWKELELSFNPKEMFS